MKSNLLILTLAVVAVFIGGCVSQEAQPYFQPQPPAFEKKNVTVSIVAIWQQVRK